MPQGLDIDYGRPLNGTMAAYSQQLLLCTGKEDWPSKIEEDEEKNAAQGLGQLLGRGGKYSDPFHRVSIINGSFEPASSDVGSSDPTTSAYLLPDFKWIPNIPLNMNSLEGLTQGFLTARGPISGLAGTSTNTMKHSDSSGEHIQARDFHEALVLICGHKGRDERCGVMGPLLRSEFHNVISSSQELDLRTDDASNTQSTSDQTPTSSRSVRVGLISHIGGHRFAGNVIVYIPPTFGFSGKAHPLMGKGIWYGRVEPKHVDGIIRETVLNGNVISELFRGGIDRDGRVLRL